MPIRVLRSVARLRRSVRAPRRDAPTSSCHDRGFSPALLERRQRGGRLSPRPTPRRCSRVGRDPSRFRGGGRARLANNTSPLRAVPGTSSASARRATVFLSRDVEARRRRQLGFGDVPSTRSNRPRSPWRTPPRGVAPSEMSVLAAPSSARGRPIRRARTFSASSRIERTESRVACAETRGRGTSLARRSAVTACEPHRPGLMFAANTPPRARALRGPSDRVREHRHLRPNRGLIAPHSAFGARRLRLHLHAVGCDVAQLQAEDPPLPLVRASLTGVFGTAYDAVPPDRLCSRSATRPFPSASTSSVRHA